ncbi:MAG: heme-binding domain-containing protein [Verrucomicrobia bacterium]|nr:heme-binding domain-containing protein [Verrucomicrobiota bacterium]
MNTNFASAVCLLPQPRTKTAVFFVACSGLFAPLAFLSAAETPVPTVEQLLKDVTVAEGFEATIFATPDQVNYPVFCAAAPDGTLFVSSDKNGSLGRSPNMGKIVRLRDTKGTGRADEVKDFVPNVDAPRGLVWDKDRLYLVHPPHLSVYIDKDGDGAADEEKVLVKNVAFGYKDRPADHTTNGLSIGVDGWLYIACGDFGFMEAEGADGRKLQLRGGGVARVRPDGTGLELYAYGTRNILEVAVSPLLDGFTRDNTNDGDGWDVRFHHISGLENHGYPRLYRFFQNELIKPLADYGGGSGCGAVWIEEPGFPTDWNNLPYTCDWGPGPLFRHRVRAKGATFEEWEKPASLVTVPKSTDADVDGMSHVYVNSWKNGTFKFTDPNVGFITRVSPKGYTAEALPDFAEAGEGELLGVLVGNSHRRRLEAQRELLRRGLTPTCIAALQDLVKSANAPLASRVAALFALKQGQGEAAHAFIAEQASDPSIAAWAIRALTDRWDQLANVPAAPILAGLKSADARVRKESVVAVSRLGKVDLAGHLAPLLDDPDSVVAHTTVESLIRLKASSVAFSVVDDRKAPVPAFEAALRVLQMIHEPGVVDGVIQRFEKEGDSGRRVAFTRTLSRLYHVEGVWNGDSWGTRPDTRGPYYQPEKWAGSDKISEVLVAALNKAGAEEAAAMSSEFARHRIKPGDALGKLVALAQESPEVIPTLARQLAQEESIPEAAVPILTKALLDEKQTDFVRSLAVVALVKTDNAPAFEAMHEVLPKLAKSRTGYLKEIQTAELAFMDAPRLENFHQRFEEEAAALQGEQSKWAEQVLIKLAKRKSGAPESRIMTGKALEEGWAASPQRRKQIMSAMMALKTTYRPLEKALVLALEDADESVRKTAASAITSLKLDPEKILAEDKPSGPVIATLQGEDVIREVEKKKGNAGRGEQLFVQQGCVNCHTTALGEPLKGPYLGTIAQTYNRRELAEAILYPNKTIAQGFVTSVYTLKDGTTHMGFVVQEGAKSVTLRNIAGQEIAVAVEQIAKHETDPRSMMPEGLVGNLSVTDFASLLDYLADLAKGGK